MRTLASVIALAACGCASMTTLQTARTLEKGDIAYDFAGVATSDLGRDMFERGVTVGPQFVAGARGGLADGVDFGIHIWPVGFKAGPKARLIDTDYFALSVAPEIGLEKTYAFYGVDLYLPLLVEVDFTDFLALYASPKAIGRMSIFHGFTTDLGVGGSVGFAISVTDSVTILPEASVLYPAYRGEDWCGLQVGPLGSSCPRPGAPIVAFAVGVSVLR